MKNSNDSSPISEAEKRQWLAWAAELKPAFAVAEPQLLEYERNLSIEQRFALLAQTLRFAEAAGTPPPADLHRPWTHANRFLT